MPDRRFIDELDEVWRSIAELARSLDAPEWDLPTDCPGWTVRDQLSHMLGTEGMLLGRGGPPPAPEGLAHVRNPIGQMNEAHVEARRTTPGPELLKEWESVTAERLAALRKMTDEDLDKPGPSPIGVVPYYQFMDVRVMDCWVHEQDMRRAVAKPGDLEGAGAATTVRRFSTSLGFVVGKRLGPPEGTTVVIDLTGPLARTLAVSVVDGRAQTVDAPATPTVRLRMDAETFTCLVAGRWHVTKARPRVEIEGDTALGEAVLANLATIP